MASESIATKEREPAPAEASASSKNICTKRSHSYDSTLLKKCQAYYDGIECEYRDILKKYENMSVKEQRAFNMGKSYYELLNTKNEVEKMLVRLKGEDEDDTAGI